MRPAKVTPTQRRNRSNDVRRRLWPHEPNGVASATKSLMGRISPELVLVDPELGELLRELLPEPGDCLAPRPLLPPALTTVGVDAVARVPPPPPLEPLTTVGVAPVAVPAPEPARPRPVPPPPPGEAAVSHSPVGLGRGGGSSGLTAPRLRHRDGLPAVPCRAAERLVGIRRRRLRRRASRVGQGLPLGLRPREQSRAAGRRSPLRRGRLRRQRPPPQGQRSRRSRSRIRPRRRSRQPATAARARRTVVVP